MVETNISYRQLMNMGEYHLAGSQLRNKGSLSVEESLQLNLCDAYTTQNLDFFFESLSYTDLHTDIIFEIHFLSGSYNTCKDLLPNIQNPYLKFRYFLANQEYAKASTCLGGCEKDGFWYYSMGRLYGHQSQYKLSFEAHKSAIDYFKMIENSLMEIICLANLGTYKNLNNQILEAEKIFFRVEQFLNNRLDLCGFFEARLRLNLGHFLLERADFPRAKLNLEKAYNILQKTQSNEFARAALLLANFYLEAASYDRVPKILSKVIFYKDYQKLDSLRYQAVAYSRMGMHALAELKMESAMDLLPKAMDVHKFYVPIDSIEILYNSGEHEEAQTLLNDHLKYCRNENDLAFWYSLNRWNYINDSDHYLKDSLKFHEQNNLGIEEIRDLLCWYRELLRLRAPQSQITLVQTRLSQLHLPEIYKQRFDLYNSIFEKNPTVLNNLKKDILDSSDIKSQLLFIVSSLVLNGIKSLQIHIHIWEHLQKQLSWGELVFSIKTQAKTLGISLHLPNSLENKSDLYLDNLTGEVLFEGKTLFTREKKSVLWNFLIHTLENSQEIEDISSKVFSVQEFNPEIHNNNINVSLSRINRLLPDQFRFKKEEGKIILPSQFIMVS